MLRQCKTAAMLLILMVILLAACVRPTTQPAQNDPVQSPTALEPTESVSVPPTETPMPATETPLPTSTIEQPDPTSGPVSFGPENYPSDVNPLTGLVVNNPALLNRRPLSVKVQLFPRMQRPPFGISQADIVYDYYQNSGMTRFHAIFYGQDAERVSPIRSARLFDQHIVRMYKSIMAFGGADGRILRVFLNADFANRLVMEGSHNCPPMCRVDPNGFNFLTTNTANLTQYVIEKGIDNNQQNLKGMFFHETPPAGGQPGEQVSVRFSMSAYTRWDYDTASGRYLRFQDTTETASSEDESYAPMVDGQNNQHIASENVVILYVPHTYAFQTKPGNAEIIDILFTGSGLAYALRDGQLYEVRWNRPDNASVLFLTYPDGQLFPFKPGATWFEVIGQSSKITNQAPGFWRFTFGIP